MPSLGLLLLPHQLPNQFLRLIILGVNLVVVGNPAANRILAGSHLPQELGLSTGNNRLISARLVEDIVNPRHEVPASIHQTATRTIEDTALLECAHVDVVPVHPSSDRPAIGPRDTASRQLTAPHRRMDQLRRPEVLPDIVEEVPHCRGRATKVSSLTQRVEGHRTRTSSTSSPSPSRSDDS